TAPASGTSTALPPTHTATPQAPTFTRSSTVTGTCTQTASSTATVTATPTAPSTATDTPTATATDIPTLEALAIHADPDWVRDAQGRVVILRGANYSGLEFGNFVGNRNGPAEADFAQMEGWGFNVIRLPIAWSYLEAQPIQFDDTYLREQVDAVVD